MLPSWIFLALLLFWAVGAYNRIVRLRSAAIQAFGGLDAHLMRMMAMLGEYEAAQGPAPAAHADARAALWAATTQFGASLAVARARPLDAGAGAALLTAREVLEAAWLAMVRVAEVPQAPDEGAALPLWAQRWQEPGGPECAGHPAVQRCGAAVQPGHRPISGAPAGVAVRVQSGKNTVGCIPTHSSCGRNGAFPFHQGVAASMASATGFSFFTTGSDRT